MIKVKKVNASNQVIQEGTPLTDEVFKKINWREDNNIEFSSLTSNVLPSQKTGVTQIVTLLNGETYIVPPYGKGQSLRIVLSNDLTMGKGVPASDYLGLIPASVFNSTSTWLSSKDRDSGVSFSDNGITMWGTKNTDTFRYYDKSSSSSTPVFRFDKNGVLYKGSSKAIYSDELNLTPDGDLVFGVTSYEKKFQANTSTSYSILVYGHEQEYNYKYGAFADLKNTDVLLIQVVTSTSTSSYTGLNTACFIISVGDFKSGRFYAQETSQSTPTTSSISIDGGVGIFYNSVSEDDGEYYRDYGYISVVGRNTNSIPKGIKIILLNNVNVTNL